MSYNSKSNTSPTCSTQTTDVAYNPYDRSVLGSHFQVNLDAQAVYGGHYPEYPFRPAEYAQNWSGVRYFQTWNSLGGMFNGEGDYRTQYRQYVSRGNVDATAQLILYR